MSDIKKLITERIVEPAANSRSSSVISGKILSSNEIANLCKVRITDKTGNDVIRENVPVFIYNKSIIDWFPKERDEVLLQERNGVLYVIGPTDSSFARIRARISLKNDIYSESFLDGVGGYIF